VVICHSTQLSSDLELESKKGEWSYYRFDFDGDIGTCKEVTVALIVASGDGDLFGSFELTRPNYYDTNGDLPYQSIQLGSVLVY